MVGKGSVIGEQNYELVFLETTADAAFIKLRLGRGKTNEFVAVIGDPLPAMGFQKPREVAIKCFLRLGVQ